MFMRPLQILRGEPSFLAWSDFYLEIMITLLEETLTVLWTYDKTNSGEIETPDKVLPVFLHTINACYNLIDAWRDSHKGQRNYTWTGRNPTDNSLIRTRIDFFLVGRALKPFITSTDIRPYVHSDHECISLTFDLEQVSRGPGYWHFNNELLTDLAFQAEIEEFWTDWRQKFEEFEDPLQWWG